MARYHKKTKKKKSDKKIFNKNVWIIGGIAVIILLIFILKGQDDKPDLSVSGNTPEANSAAPDTQATPELPEERLDYLLGKNEPIFAFFHSNNCHLCIEMIKVVDSVFPQYEGRVNLIDINVYDQINQNLLRRAQINAIPTQIFINRSGEMVRSVGLMSADQLREALDKIAGED